MKTHLPHPLRVALIAAAIASTTYAEDTKLELNQSATVTAATNDVNLTENDRVGYIDENGDLYTAFKATADMRTQNYQVNGNLTIGGNAQVAVGGGANSTLGTLKVQNGTVTVKDNGYLTATKAVIKNLVINSGTVELHTNGGENGIDAFGSGNASYTESGKMAAISNSVTINGGTLTLGVSNGAYVTSKYTTKHATSGFKGSINQTGGTMSVRGDSALSGAVSINQTGTKEANMYFTDNLELGTSLTVNQSNDNATLVIGRLTGSSAYSSKNTTINQTGGGYIQLAQGSYFGKASTINVSQSGSGSIDIGGNISTATAKAAGRDTYYDANRPNTFTDNNTTYTLDQTGSTGTINVKGAITVSNLTIDTGATLNLTNTLTLTDSEIDIIVTGDTDKGISFGKGGNLMMSEAAVSLKLSEVVIDGWFEGVEGTIVTQSITLMSGFSDDFAAGLLGEGGMLSLGEATVLSTAITRAAIEYYEIKGLELSITKTDNVNTLQAVVTVENIPEPTTATLSLLALAALASRRRRK